MTASIDDALRTWDEQTARVEAAQSLEPQNIEAALQALPAQRAAANALPSMSAAELEQVQAAISRFEAALKAKQT
jgi:hypothetical protein